MQRLLQQLALLAAQAPQSTSTRKIMADLLTANMQTAHILSEGGTPERLSPQGRTAVGRGFITYEATPRGR